MEFLCALSFQPENSCGYMQKVFFLASTTNVLNHLDLSSQEYLGLWNVLVVTLE